MKKLALMALLTLSTAQAAPAFVEVFQPKPERMAARCVEGETDATKTLPSASDPNLTASLKAYTEYLKGLSNDRTIALSDMKAYPANPYLTLQTTYGSAFNICKNAAKRLEARPVLKAGDLNVWINIEGRVSEVRYARDWKAVIVFRDAVGTEIKRFTPIKSYVGELDDWKVSCSKSPCTYSGRNSYLFTATDELLKVAGSAAKMSVLTSLGSYGIKEYEVPLATLTEALK